MRPAIVEFKAAGVSADLMVLAAQIKKKGKENR
jgi:hypothetical protein